METVIVLLGLWMLYTIGHYVILSLSRLWKDLTPYEKVVAVSAVISVISLVATIAD